MPLRDLLRKKDKLSADQDRELPEPLPPKTPSQAPQIPQFTFVRSTTTTQEIIEPPTFAGDVDFSRSRKPPLPALNLPLSESGQKQSLAARIRKRASSNPGPRSQPVQDADLHPLPEKASMLKRGLSQRLHLPTTPRRASSSGSSSLNIPADLPAIADQADDETGTSPAEKEAKWEQRGILLARANTVRSASPRVAPVVTESVAGGEQTEKTRPATARKASSIRSVEAPLVISDPKGDENIQEAIRLHEAGELKESTEMFGRLADPNGANNALSQVLYGLALRHGWGCAPDPAKAVTYLSSAASNSASIESAALSAGKATGGAAKGELVLAIFELANCFRYGWGVDIDPVAARHYYETAANLGDTDAMNEVAWCYLQGFGGKKDKLLSAKYYRRAEKEGNKILGNSWIWKEKYDPK